MKHEQKDVYKIDFLVLEEKNKLRNYLLYIVIFNSMNIKTASATEMDWMEDFFSSSCNLKYRIVSIEIDFKWLRAVHVLLILSSSMVCSVSLLFALFAD